MLEPADSYRREDLNEKRRRAEKGVKSRQIGKGLAANVHSKTHRKVLLRDYKPQRDFLFCFLHSIKQPHRTGQPAGKKVHMREGKLFINSRKKFGYRVKCR